MFRSLVVSLIFLTACTGPGGKTVQDDRPWRNLEGNALFERGEDYYAAGRFPEALITYKEYYEKFPDTYRGNDAFYRMAQCLEALGDRHEAAEQYRKTGVVYPKCDLAPSAFLRAGELFELEGCTDDAVWCYRRASDYGPKAEADLAVQRLADLERRMITKAPPKSLLGRFAAGLSNRDRRGHHAAVAEYSASSADTDADGASASLFTTGYGIGGPSVDPYAPDRAGTGSGGAVFPSGSIGGGGTSGGRSVTNSVAPVAGPTPAARTGTAPSGLVPTDVISIYYPPTPS